MTRREVVVLLATGLLAGFASGLFGVGGGIVMVPLLVTFMRATQHRAQATSLAAIVPIAAAAAATFALSDAIDYELAAGFAFGSLMGVPLGVRLMAAATEESLRIAFGVLQVAVGILLLVTG